MTNRSATRAAEPTRDLHTWTPSFWPEKPNLWFKQLDIHFEANEVKSDQGKFSFALAFIEATNAGEVADLISKSGRQKDRYETLRTEMVGRLSATRSSKIQRLFEREEIGDWTPSQFLKNMRTLAGEAVTDEFLRTMWLSRLLQAVQIITSAVNVPLDQLAVAADRIHDTMPKVTAISVKTNQT
ncbi:uncharacterized protein LOC122535234 [Frieseomelitta varia]|uniref:uncharacterized protein LOC122535234 n=1 Tax=Frieseomelitta varia TaxID=561572 RepID=UPI001CB68073|nr:uncharacterized protein LOC122535234 [Frieseomelitta varia]